MVPRFKKIILIAILLLFSISNLFSVAILLNDSKIDEFFGSDSLINIYPPLIDLWQIEVTTEDNTLILKDNINIEKFDDFTITNNVLNINIQNFKSVKSINIQGEKLVDKNLEVWIGWEGTDELKTIIYDWGNKNDITINIINSTNSTSKLKTINKSRTTPPDLVLVAGTDIINLQKDDVIQPLPSYLLKNIVDNNKSQFIVNNQYYAMPFYYDVQLLFYNPNLVDLNKYNPLTFENIEYEANQLIDTVEIPLSWNSYSMYWLLPFIYSYNKDNKINFHTNLSIDNLPTLKAITYIKQLNDKPYFKPLEKNAMLSYFINGKTAIILSASYSIPYFNKLDIDYDIKAFPLNNYSNQYLKPLTDTKVFVIPKSSHHTILAYRLIQYLQSYEIQKQFCKALYKISPNEKVLLDLEKSNKFYKTILSTKENFETIPQTEDYQIYKNILWKLLRFVFTNQLTPQQVIEKGEQLFINNKEN